jgi:hypothetical protein
MFTNSYVAAKLDRERQREMHAGAERQGVARQAHALSRAAKSVERRPIRRVRRALRAVFT